MLINLRDLILAKLKDRPGGRVVDILSIWRWRRSSISKSVKLTQSCYYQRSTDTTMH